MDSLWGSGQASLLASQAQWYHGQQTSHLWLLCEMKLKYMKLECVQVYWDAAVQGGTDDSVVINSSVSVSWWQSLCVDYPHTYPHVRYPWSKICKKITSLHTALSAEIPTVTFSVSSPPSCVTPSNSRERAQTHLTGLYRWLNQWGGVSWFVPEY